MGKVLVLDMILNVAKYGGESRFEQAGEWAKARLFDSLAAAQLADLNEAVRVEGVEFLEFFDVIPNGRADFERFRRGEEVLELVEAIQLAQQKNENIAGSRELKEGGRVNDTAREGGFGFDVEAEEFFAAQRIHGG